MMKAGMRAGLAGTAIVFLASGGTSVRAHAQTADAPRPVTLQEAVRLAERNSPSMVQARGNVHTSVTAQRAAYAAFVPNVSVTMSGTRQQSSSSTRINNAGELVQTPQQPWTYNSGLNANVNLFDGGRRFYEIRQSAASVDAAEANQILIRFRGALDVKQQYYGVLAARESEGAALAQVRQAEEQLKAATARIQAGAATKSDSLRSAIALGNANLALLTARNDLRNANAALTRFVGTPFVVTATEDDSLDRTPPALDSASLMQMAEEGPAVQQAKSELAVARAGRRVARTSYFPTIDASYSRSGSGTDNRFGSGPDILCPQQPSDPGAPRVFCPSYNYNGSLRFSLSLPLFNQLSREEAIIRADAAEDNAAAQLRDARLFAQQNLTQQLGALQTAQQRIEIQSASVDAAQEDLRVQQQRYSLGASTLLDVLTSQTQLDQARSALIAARFDYRIAKAQLEALIGRDL